MHNNYLQHVNVCGRNAAGTQRRNVYVIHSSTCEQFSFSPGGSTMLTSGGKMNMYAWTMP
jgi:hypothetical protein